MKRTVFAIVFALVGFSFAYSQGYSQVVCPNCHGHGGGYVYFYGYPQWTVCPVCKGAGFVFVPSQSNVSFGGGQNSDGYIHQGRITLYRVGSGRGDTFELYTKRNVRFVRYGGRYINIDQTQTVTIDNIKYKTH